VLEAAIRHSNADLQREFIARERFMTDCCGQRHGHYGATGEITSQWLIAQTPGAPYKPDSRNRCSGLRLGYLSPRPAGRNLTTHLPEELKIAGVGGFGPYSEGQGRHF
jgi:hypothetical protein